MAILAGALVAGALLGACGATTPSRTTTTSGIPASLLAGERPIGRGARFQPPLAALPVPDCSARLGRRDQAHVELFGANRVVLIAAGIGTAAPRDFREGRLVHAACFGAVVTLDDTGTVYFRPGRRPSLASLFRAWGQPLSATRIASFTGGTVRAYVNGRRRAGSPGSLRLSAGAEVVLEIGPHVPPHTRFAFPAPPSPELG